MQALAFPSIKHHSTEQKSHLPQTTGTSSRLSEVILAGNSTQANLTLAMLAHLSHQHKAVAQANRWLTWICPMQVGKEALETFDFDVLGMRILHPKSESQIPTLMQAALNAGTSHTVAVQCTGFSSKLYPWLEQAATSGECDGLIIRPQY